MRQRSTGTHRANTRTQFLLDRFSEDYPAYQYSVVEFLVEQMTDMSRTFGGDLQQMLLLSIIGQMRLKALREASLSMEDPALIPLNRTSTTASRLADITGISRETVRRKLALLETKGWIVQEQDHSWRLAVEPDGINTPARRSLTEQDERLRLRVARLVAELEAQADQH